MDWIKLDQDKFELLVFVNAVIKFGINTGDSPPKYTVFPLEHTVSKKDSVLRSELFA
jgi:hypothetical protein